MSHQLASVVGGGTSSMTYGVQLGPYKANLFTTTQSDHDACASYARAHGQRESDCR